MRVSNARFATALTVLQGLSSEEKTKRFEHLSKREMRNLAKEVDKLFSHTSSSLAGDEKKLEQVAETLLKSVVVEVEPSKAKFVTENKRGQSMPTRLQRIRKAARSIFTALEKTAVSLGARIGYASAAILDKKLQDAFKRRDYLEHVQPLFQKLNELREKEQEFEKAYETALTSKNADFNAKNKQVYEHMRSLLEVRGEISAIHEKIEKEDKRL